MTDKTYYPGVIQVDPDVDPGATDRKRHRGIVDDERDEIVWVGPVTMKHYAQADALDAAAKLKRGESPITGELTTKRLRSVD